MRVERALMEVLNGHSGPVAAALMRWLVHGEHTVRENTVDIGWPSEASEP
jgi:hypothetical protein